jgi:catechol 2,3-dioxygenase-like lactoylglutathione lyase family enzyme
VTALRLDHVNIRTARIAESVRFYGEGLGLEIRPVPGQEDLALGAYAYDAGGIPVVHLVGTEDEIEGSKPVRGAAQFGMIDHFALSCDTPQPYADRLTRLGYEFSRRDVALIGMHLLFVRDPNGVLVELGFPLESSNV